MSINAMNLFIDKYDHKNIYQLFHFIIGKLTSRHLENKYYKRRNPTNVYFQKSFFLESFNAGVRL